MQYFCNKRTRTQGPVNSTDLTYIHVCTCTCMYMCPGHAGWIRWAHRGRDLPLMCTLLQRAMVLASPIPGSMSIGWWATWLTHKQLKCMKSRHPGEPWMYTAMTNKEWTLPSIFNIPTPQGGTRIAKTKICDQTYWNQTPWSCASIPLYSPQFL